MGLIPSDHAKRWPGGCMVWRFHEGLSEDERTVFEGAMTHWGNRANVRFLERTTQSSFVTFKSDSNIDNVNHSTSIGMKGGEQFILLEPITESDSRGRSARHEIGHALGFHHEHKRCDRDDFVVVNESKLKLERAHDFQKLCGNDVKKVGDYDFRSVMHYNPTTSATTDGSPALSGSNDANQTRLDDRASRRFVSAGDTDTIGVLHGGSAHVYQLSHDGQIERTVRQYDWTSGWTTATPFQMDLRNFLFMIKRSTGRMHISAINHDGTIGDIIDNRDWSSGWTTAIKYAIGPTNYFLYYKRGDGTVHIHTINVDGKVGPKVADVEIESGWTTIRQYAVGLNNFLVFINSSSGAMRVRRINWDGKVGESIQSSDWTTGWTSVLPYSAGGGDYLFRLKAATGAVSIRRINGDGKIGSETDNADFSAGIDTVSIYEINGTRYLFTLESENGQVRIRRLNGNGTVGGITDRREFGAGWTLGATYKVGLGTYLLLVKLSGE